MSVTAIIGAQYGSEGKGLLAAHLADEYNVHVRVGSPNAGHTFYWRGEKHVMQTIPCGWINPCATIIIGRGALINMDLLVKEIQHIEKYYPDFKNRLFIDEDAGVLDERFHEEEGGVDGEIHKRIGSTGEGVGVTRIARIQRDPSKFKFFKDVCKKYKLEMCAKSNTPHTITHLSETQREHVLLEGSQGSALSLLHSHYPYCTSIDTNAAQLLAEIGLAPQILNEVVLVARTFPIRVAGNSGPMEYETTWDYVSKCAGRTIEEKTTVTKKVRRVAHFDPNLIYNAMVYNGSRSILMLNFVNYIDPELWDCKDIDDLRESEALKGFCIRNGLNPSKIKYWGTGADTVIEGGFSSWRI